MKPTSPIIRRKGTITLTLNSSVRHKLIQKKNELNAYAEKHGLSPVKDKLLYEFLILQHGEIDYANFSKFRTAQLKKKEAFIMTTAELNGRCHEVLTEYLEKVRELSKPVSGRRSTRQPTLKDVYNYLFFTCNLTVKTFFDE